MSEPTRPAVTTAEVIAAANADPHAVLHGVTLRPTGSGGVMAVCEARHQHENGGMHSLVIGSFEEPPDLAELAHTVAEHRAGDHERDNCTCREWPSDGTIRYTVDPGCVQHGTVAQALDDAGEYRWLLRGLRAKLGRGQDSYTDDLGAPEHIIAAVYAALAECREALNQPDRADLVAGAWQALDRFAAPRVAPAEGASGVV